METESTAKKKCPFCTKEIQAAASVCWYCLRDLPPEAAPLKAPVQPQRLWVPAPPLTTPAPPAEPQPPPVPEPPTPPPSQHRNQPAFDPIWVAAIGILGLTILLAALIVITGEKPPIDSPPPPPQVIKHPAAQPPAVGPDEIYVEPPKASEPSTDSSLALQQMSDVFEGNPSESTIKEKLDRALRMYGLEPTEENYNRAGSVLAKLTDDNGVSEMAILETMLVSPMPRVKFYEAAALVAVELRLTKER